MAILAMSLSLLLDIPCILEKSLGSIKRLWVARASSIATESNCCSGNTVDLPTLQNDIDWVEHYFLPDQAQFQMRQRSTPNGIHFELEVSIRIPRIRNFVAHEIRKLKGAHLVLIVEDWNGYIRQLGTVASPMRLLVTARTGLSRAAANGYAFTFAGVSMFEPCYLNASPDEIPAGNGDFDSLDFDPRDFYTELG